MIRRASGLVVALVVMAGTVLVGAVVPVPFVALGLGPTFDTLGDVDGTPVVAVRGLPTYPTTGHLNMTTVGVTDHLTTAQAVQLWASPQYQVVPRNSVFPPGESNEQVGEENRRQFVDSQTNAEAAALAFVGRPVTVTVAQLTGDSPAAGRLEVDDALLAVDGTPVSSIPGLQAALAGTRPGQQVAVQVRRGDATLDVPVVLAPRPDGPQGMLGIAPGARPADPDIVTISLGDIGGPSAGLMFSLAVVDKLTPGDLAGGRFVAGTGAIGADGAVAAIRGIPFKMAKAREVGATVFLVPAGNCDEARDTAPDGLQLVRVDGLADAVADLDLLRSGGTPSDCSVPG